MVMKWCSRGTWNGDRHGNEGGDDVKSDNGGGAGMVRKWGKREEEGRERVRVWEK